MTEKRSPGRPTKYKPEYAEQAHKLALLGATNEQLADFFEVATSTVDLWIKENEAFSGAVKAGRLEADAAVASSLYHRAKGYSHPAVKIMAVNGEVREVGYTEHYPPDATSMIFWLKNRRPDLWRDKVETTTNHRVVDEDDKPVGLTELARRMAFLLASAGEAQAAPAASPPQQSKQ